MPVALLEAAAAGVRLKASDIRGSREILKHAEKNTLERYDVAEIKRRMKEIYEAVSRERNT